MSNYVQRIHIEVILRLVYLLQQIQVEMQRVTVAEKEHQSGLFAVALESARIV